MTTTQMRHASLTDLVEMLREQHVRKVDMVVPASKMRLKDGDLSVSDVPVMLTDDGVLDPSGLYRPTTVFDEGISARFDIPLGYVRRMRGGRVDLLDANVNGWLHGAPGTVVKSGDWDPANPTGNWVTGREEIPGDTRSFLVRAFRGDDSETGIARALLSDRYSIVDNLDVLMSVLQGVRAAGVNAVVDRADLTERRMTVRIVAPEVQVLAERLLRGYRNPFGPDFERWRNVADREGLGYGGEEPIIFAGLRISNSETGDGAFTITPEVTVKVCANGLVITKDAIREVHLGGRLSEGVVRWSEDTVQRNSELVVAKTADAVKTFLDVDYMTKVIADMEEKAEEQIDVDTVEVIGKRLKFTDSEMSGILSHFIRGGQTTRGGMMQAVSSYAQMVEDPDAARDMEGRAVAALTA